MKSSRSKRRSAVSEDIQELLALAEQVGKSVTITGLRTKQNQLLETVENHLLQGHEDTLTDTLDSLFEDNRPAYNALADHIEAVAESMTVLIDDQPYTAVLIATPVLAWSRYTLPSGNLPIKLINALQTQLATHVVSENVRLTLANYLFSPDQLPRTFYDTRKLLGAMTEAVLSETALSVDHNSLPETNQFLADVRYLLAGALVSQGQTVFRWQETSGESAPKRETALHAWQQHGLPILEPLLAGCAFQGLLTNTYHEACRQADEAVLPFSVQASASLLHAMTNIEPLHMQATVCACYEQALVEYRIGLGPKSPQLVYHGIVWPLLDGHDEERNHDIPSKIENALRAVGIVDITFFTQHFPTEVCDDCNAPFYPNRDGELVHAEMPASLETTNVTLH